MGDAMPPTDKHPPQSVEPPGIERPGNQRPTGPQRISLDRAGKRRDEEGSPRPESAPHMALAMAPPRTVEERLGVLEFHVPRLEKTVLDGFADMKTTCIVPLITRMEEEKRAREVERVKAEESQRELLALLEREKTIKWWVSKTIEKVSQIGSLCFFGWLWMKDSGLAKAIAARFFGLFF